MKRRNVLAVLGLSFLTIGIYCVYWLYKTRLELLNYLPDKKAIPRIFILFVPILTIIGLIIVTFVIDASLPQNTLGSVLNFVTGILLFAAFVAIFVVSFWWFYRYFKAVEAVVQGNDAMLLYTLWIILTLTGFGPIWVLIVQSDLNKFIDNGYRPLKMPSSPGYANPPAEQPVQPVQEQQYAQPQPQQQPYAAPQQQDFQQHHGHEHHHPHHHHENGHHHDGHPNSEHQDQQPSQPYQN